MGWGHSKPETARGQCGDMGDRLGHCGPLQETTTLAAWEKTRQNQNVQVRPVQLRPEAGWVKVRHPECRWRG